MQKFYLSTPRERVMGISFSVVISFVLIALLIALRGELAIFLMTAAGVALVITILVLYVLNVSRAACIPDPENNRLLVSGFRNRTIDLADVSVLQTIPVKSGQVEGRSLALADAEGNIVTVVPTYFTSNRGYLAEPMARELAAALNLEFRETVPAWEYDPEARKAHDIEVAQQEKEEAKARREARKAHRVAKVKAKMKQMQEEDKKS